MSTLEEWAAECVGLAIEVELGWFRPRQSGDLAPSAGAQFGVLPLWRIRDHTVALLARPGTPVASWPGVLLRGEDLWTLSSDRATLVPQLLVRILCRQEGLALAQEWSTVEPGLAALHAHLEGDAATLTAVAASLGSTERPSLADPAGDDERERSRLAGALFRAVDRSPASLLYADWVDASAAGDTPAPTAVEEFGPWARRVVCWSEVLDLAGRGVGRFPAVARHAVIEATAGLDSGVTTRVAWHADVGEGSAETVLLETAMRIRQDPEAQAEYPVASALATAMDSEGPKYRGLAHAEAVVVLKDQGEPERAWDALQSAAWWSSRSLGEVPQFIVEGGRLLAQENGWRDLAAVLERSEVAD